MGVNNSNNDNKDDNSKVEFDFETEELIEHLSARHPLIAAFQSNLSNSVSGSTKSSMNLHAMIRYTKIVFKLSFFVCVFL